jgi:hypothetical protein
MRRRLIPELCPCPNVPIPMDHGSWDSPGAAGNGTHASPLGSREEVGTVLAHPSDQWTAMRVPGAKISLSLASTPLPISTILDDPGQYLRARARVNVNLELSRSGNGVRNGFRRVDFI